MVTFAKYVQQLLYDKEISIKIKEIGEAVGETKKKERT